MQWESLGFKDNPFSTDPIIQTTLSLYTGHQEAVVRCNHVLREKNVILVVEGARGVGTTSFGNYLRFNAQQEKIYFTPSNEIRVEPSWTLETLLAVIIANVVREIELFQPEKVKKDKRLQDAKALSARISEAYRSFGVEAFGFGVNYEKNAGVSSQPFIVPSAVLGHHLQDLVLVAQSLGYPCGILLQLNNLDIGAIHDGKHLKYLFNALRDYLQTDGISCLLVGDIGLRSFIAQEVDRLDDIISYEVEIGSLNRQEYEELINKRIEFYRNRKQAELPIDRDVFVYLYEITKGRLRYIFGLLHRLLNHLYVGDLTDRMTLDIAKPMIVKLACDRLSRNNLTLSEEHLLKLLVNLKKATTSELAQSFNKSPQFVSKVLGDLDKKKLVKIEKQGKNRLYTPVLDALIAYSG